MATITHRGAAQYQAIIRRKGYPTKTATFETQAEAIKWARHIEAQMDKRVYKDTTPAERTTLGQALERYSQQRSAKKKGAKQEHYRIQQLLQHPLSARPLSTLDSADFANYRDVRLETIGANSVRLELALLSNIFTVAKRDWRIHVENPLLDVEKPKLPRGRDRRLVDDEEERLLAAAHNSHTVSLLTAIQLAIETGMRAGEIVALRWEHIDFKSSVIRLRITKNGDNRIVPLSEKAESLLQALPHPIHGGRVTTFYDSNGLSAAFRRATKRANIEGLKFHDLRHEAASRLAPRMTVATLAKVMGWRSLQMAMRYYNPTAAELVAAVRAAA
ncbi:MAG: tyrosine-type recombinase/integrase [Methylophilaceae bacterium]